MPIIEDTPQTPPIKQPVPVQVAAPEYRGVVVDTAYTPATSLLTHIEGASWTVNYYSQVLGLDNALSGQNLDRPAALQQYKRIQHLELKVTTPLNTSQDQQTKEFSVTGQANVYPCGLIPNEGDHFIADVGDGREALFVITNSEKRSIYKDGAFIVDYSLVSYSDQDNRIQDLNTKVVEDLVYQADFLEHGQRPLITTDEFTLVKKLRAYYAELVDFYFGRFMSRNLRTLLLPGQDYAIYDPYLTHAVLQMFRDEAHPNIKLIRELNVQEDDNYQLPTIWTALLTKRRKALLGAMSKVGIVRANTFSSDPMMNSVRYSGVDYVIYPVDPDKSEDYRRKDGTKGLAGIDINLPTGRLKSLVDILQIDELDGLPSFDAPAINPSQQDTYVFSPNFYQRSNPGQSALELAFQDYLDEKALNLRLLMKLAVSYTSWTPLEQFYQLPFLMVLIRASIRRM